MTEVFKATTLKPSKSVPIRFIGRILADLEWQGARGARMYAALHETKGGAYICEFEGEDPTNASNMIVTVAVIETMWHDEISLSEPTYGDDGSMTGYWRPIGECGRDETTMQIAVIEAFNGNSRVKSMLKTELGWSPYRTVA